MKSNLEWDSLVEVAAGSKISTVMLDKNGTTYQPLTSWAAVPQGISFLPILKLHTVQEKRDALQLIIALRTIYGRVWIKLKGNVLTLLVENP